MTEEETYCGSEKRNKAKEKKKENKKYPYKHCRNCGKILINQEKGTK
jgi:hypothetical protein